MTIPTAESMSQAIGSVFSALDGQNLITNYSLIRTLCGTLKRDRGNSWRINISDAEPITFKTITDKNNKEIVPQIMVDLHVDTTNADFPYLKWLVALELRQLNAQRTPVAKWHFDLASSAQDGPRIHLQCGGHFAGNDVARNMELSLDVPRWHHPAIDLLLLTEIAVANFYKNEWMQLKQMPQWSKSISVSENLCYRPYFNKVMPILDQSTQTILGSVWNDSWN